jgi:response regulator NasT
MPPLARIVVADDEGDLVEELKELLEETGYEVVGTARNGKELVDCCRASRPDLVITDIRMPDMDGLQAGRLIQLERPTPLIVVSAYKDEELIDRAAGGNVYAYLLKPLNPSELAATIPAVLNRFREAHPDLEKSDQACGWFG